MDKTAEFERSYSGRGLTGFLMHKRNEWIKICTATKHNRRQDKR